MNNKKIAILIKKLALEFDKLSNPTLAPYDLTPTQFKILKYLYDHENVIGMDIQNAYSMTNPTVTGILQNMESGGWVERVGNPNDSRSKIIILTKKSLDKKDELYNLGENLEKEFTKGLTKEEYKELLKLLDKMIGGINK